MALMWTDENRILHVVDRDTKFRATYLLSGESTNDVWEALISICVSPYVSFLGEVATYQGIQIVSEE